MHDGRELEPDSTDAQVDAVEASVSHSRVREMLNGLPDPYVLLEAVRDDSGSITDYFYLEANDAACAFNRRTHGELVGARVLDLLPGMAAAGLMDMYARVVETGEPLELEAFSYAVELRGDEERLYDIRAVRVGDGLSYTWRDVTDRVRAARALAEADVDAKYRLLAENASDVVIRWAPGGLLVWVSPSVEAVLGWRPEELQGRYSSTLVHPDDFERVKAQIRAALAEGSHAGRGEARYATADGGWRWMAGMGRALFDPDGTPAGAIDSLRDIESERQARSDLIRSEQQFRLAMDSAPHGMALLDLQHRITAVNPALCQMLALDDVALLGVRIFDLLDHDPPTADFDDAAPADIQRRADESRLRRGDGTRPWVKYSIGTVRDLDGRPQTYVGQFVDISEEKLVAENLHFVAEHDPLTGLLNRRALLARITRLLGHPPRAGRGLAVLFIDLDGLKQLNDLHGHAGGDIVLVGVASRLAAVARVDDLVARIGGDEFVVALTAVADSDDALAVADKIHQSLLKPFDIEATAVTATVSIGISTAHPGDRATDVLRKADSALYRAKRAGRHRTAVAGDTTDTGSASAT